jgi:ubiquinone/menaquinone biosynthesis C-methylase UbiE
MKHCAQLSGSEFILDLGTGAGFIAIAISKILNTGSVVGVDKYDREIPVLEENLLEELKINFFGKTLHQAQINAKIENQQGAITFVKTDLKKHFPFSSYSFDCIFSSQFLYCIPSGKIDKVLSEIDRVLKPNGRIVFFESKKFINWDISIVENYYRKEGYKTQVIPLNNMSNKCIFTASKPVK